MKCVRQLDKVGPSTWIFPIYDVQTDTKFMRNNTVSGGKIQAHFLQELTEQLI